MKTDNNKTENVRIEKEVLEKARDYCKKNGITLTWFVSRAVESALDRRIVTISKN